MLHEPVVAFWVKPCEGKGGGVEGMVRWQRACGSSPDASHAFARMQAMAAHARQHNLLLLRHACQHDLLETCMQHQPSGCRTPEW